METIVTKEMTTIFRREGHFSIARRDGGYCYKASLFGRCSYTEFSIAVTRWRPLLPKRLIICPEAYPNFQSPGREQGHCYYSQGNWQPPANVDFQSPGREQGHCNPLVYGLA
jgi:hypothetical protein